MSDDTGMALFAYIDAIHLDDALARMETCDGCHRAWCETETSKREIGETSGAIATAHYYAGDSGIQMKRNHPNKQLSHPVHKIA